MVTIYVEGGGDAASLKSQCRRAFSELFRKAGFHQGKLPSVRPMGGRAAAFRAFRMAHDASASDEFVMLLVDSEEIPTTKQPWSHLEAQDGWDKPSGASDDQVQLMVVCMETWLLSGFRTSQADLEKRSKTDIYNDIQAAKPKGKYEKARDSFKLLSQSDPEKLKRLWWADRFLTALKAHC